MKQPHIKYTQNRRDFLQHAGMGFGSLAFTHLMSQNLRANEKAPSALSSNAGLNIGKSHFPATAKSVIFLFMEGGPSHLDTFDPKPLIKELEGQPLPESFGKVILAMGEHYAPLLASKRQWKQHGESGLWVSDWFPHVAQSADDLAVIRSCWAEGINHSSGVCQMNTCSILGGRPSLGAWVTYGLGTENENLPAFVVMQDNQAQVTNGPRNWSAGFMPAAYQGVRIGEGDVPIPNLNPPAEVSARRQQNKLSLLEQFNSQYAQQHPEQSELDARIKSYELAFHMQAEAPIATNLDEETQATQEMYGLNQKETAPYGKMCLMARRLVERGVRFVQLYSGAGSKWDSHSNIEGNHSALCKGVDRPIAALLKDLKQRGLLESTLVIWGGEFGRTPMSEKGNGRDHNPTGFTMWMAGGGVKGGQVIGATDELGLRAIDQRMHVKDIHTCILHLMGLNNMELMYNYKGRPERPTINEGEFNTKLVTG